MKAASSKKLVWYVVKSALHDIVQVVHTVACKREADVEISALFPILAITLSIATFMLIAPCEGIPRTMSGCGQVTKQHFLLKAHESVARLTFFELGLRTHLSK